MVINMFCYILRLSLNKTSTDWSRATDQTQMYPDRDTIPQLLPSQLFACFAVIA